MVNSSIKRQNSGLLRMESLSRFRSIPLIETSINSGLKVYNRVKKSNSLIEWTLDTSENTAIAVIESFRPAVRIIEGPLQKVDQIGLKVLDMVEQKMPSAYLPPQMIYWNTKEYVSDHVMKPVLKRADSFGDIVDGAIVKADHIVDKYLPEKDVSEASTDESDALEMKAPEDSKRSHAVLTLRRSKNLSKKLKRRLTIRAANEVIAIKNDVHVLIYACELIATNPKEAYKQFKELWQYLSAKEPENQRRPQTLEQFFVLLVRETARKCVHLMNFSSKHLAKIPRRMKLSMQEFLHQVLYFTDSLLKIAHLDKAQNIIHKIHTSYGDIKKQTNMALVRTAHNNSLKHANNDLTYLKLFCSITNNQMILSCTIDKILLLRVVASCSELLRNEFLELLQYFLLNSNGDGFSNQ